MKYSDLEDGDKLATKEWLEYRLSLFKAGLREAREYRLYRNEKIFIGAAIAVGFISGFVPVIFLYFLLISHRN